MIVEINSWTIAFLLSLAFIVGLVAYIRFLLKNINFVSKNITELNNEAVSFTSHLKSLYELESFYGDETLGGLLEHGMYFTSKIEQFSEIMDLTNEPLQDLPDEQEEDDEEAENEPQYKANQEVFYAGTRKRDS
jgi:hypothetical protein